MKRSGVRLSLGVFALALLPMWGCASQEEIAPEGGPSDLARATPSAASSYGSEVFWVDAGERSSIAGASNRARSTYYDGLELGVTAASLYDYAEFVRLYPGYGEEGWSDRGDLFLVVSIDVANISDGPVEFDVDELTVYSEAIELYDSTPYWAPILDFALAEQYGSLETRATDPGGSWGYQDGWNVIDGGQRKEFILPFRLCPTEILGKSLDGVGVGDFFLQVYAAYSDLDAARGVQPSNCYIFALPEEG